MDDLELGIHIYNADKHAWLMDDEHTWTHSLFNTATFTTDKAGREAAQFIMEREQGDDPCYLMMSLLVI